MIGVNSTTGKELKGYDHLRQSIRDILKTPIGSRVMRRDYGSRLWDLVDAPINAETLAELHIATAEALDKWEPRILIESVAVTFDPSGVRTGGDYKVVSSSNIERIGNEPLGENTSESSFEVDFLSSIYAYSGYQSMPGFGDNNLFLFAGEMLDSGYARADLDADGDVDFGDSTELFKLIADDLYNPVFAPGSVDRWEKIKEVAFNRWQAGDTTFNRYWKSSGGRATSAALIVDVSGTYLPDGKKINLEGLVV